MSQHSEVLRMYDYHVWANDTVFQHLKTLPSDIPLREIQSVFPSVFETLVHICKTDNLWLQVMKGYIFEEVVAFAGPFEAEAKKKSLSELEILFATIADQYRAFFQQLQDIEADMTLTHPRFGTITTRFSELVRHVANHGTYHRGNITAMLRQLGHPGVPTDYIKYLLRLNQKV